MNGVESRPYTFDAYQEDAMRTCILRRPYDMLVNSIIGMCGEVGECADLVKKHLHQGHSLDEKRIFEELGDVLWYCAELATALGGTLEGVAIGNVYKLQKRYPDGFDPKRSLHREDE